MGTTDKIKNKVEDVKGRAKETAGAAAGDKDMKREGKVDQVKSDLKDAGEKVKDAIRH